MLANLDKLVVKPANESGGYGILIGPQAAPEATQAMRRARERRSARLHGAAHAHAFHRATLIGDGIAPRHVDMRPFVLQSGNLYATTGGLTRVALPEGSLVVNSSQGGGSKDTWIVEDR